MGLVNNIKIFTIIMLNMLFQKIIKIEKLN
jgi:hypothetical protein